MLTTREQLQTARRSSVIDAALGLADRGGAAAVQMRDVAAAADISVRTLYKYFPSKEYLLVAILEHLVRIQADTLRRYPPEGDTPAERVMNVLRTAVSLHPEQDMFVAMVGAIASTDAGVAELVAEIMESMTGVLTGAMHTGEPSERDLAAARVLQQVWLAAVIGWLGGLDDKDRILGDLEVTTTLLLD